VDPELRVVQPDHRAACHYAEDAMQSDVGVAHMTAEPIRRKPFGAGPSAHKPVADDSIPAALMTDVVSEDGTGGAGGADGGASAPTQ
jgi:hypothetical protein